jgi:signal transduction histidine kinase
VAPVLIVRQIARRRSAAPTSDVTLSVRPQGTSSPPTPDEDAETRAAARPAYLAFIAHEMRNPLSTALWSAELLGRMSAEERGGARGEKLAGMCLRTLARLRHLVEDHFLAERLAIGGIPLRAEPLPLAEVVSKAAHRAGVVPASIEVQDLTVLADRAMIERAVETLLARVARDEAAVHVSAERKVDVVSLRVQ